MVTVPRTITCSLAQLSEAPRRMHGEHGITMLHFTLRFLHDVQERGARWVVRKAEAF